MVMQFELREDESGREIGFVCKNHGDAALESEILIRNHIRMIPRKGKRPAKEEYSVLLVRCPTCKKYQEWDLKKLVYRG